MLRRLGIRAKILAVLAVPMLVLFGAGAFISYDAIREAQRVRAAEGAVAALQAYAPLASAIQSERVLSVNSAPVEEIAAARAATDSMLAKVRPITRQLDLEEFPPSVVRQFQEVQLAHNTALPQVRTLVDGKGDRNQTANSYEAIIKGQIDLVEQVANVLDDRTLAQYVTAYRDVSATADGLVTEMLAGQGLLRARQAQAAGARVYQNLVTTTEVSRARARAAVERLGENGIAMPARDPSSSFTSMRTWMQQGNSQGFDRIDPAAYAGDIQQQLASLVSVNEAVLERASEIADDAATASETRAVYTIAIAVAAAALSLFFALVIARAIVTPLRRLTAAAADVREQLPKLVEQVAVPGEGPEIVLQPIPVNSRDEVGKLADAFNSVNATTVQVAQEQAALRGSIAEMFVNVARRDQVLLNRQLSFIDSLERAEEDPSTLANLFRLDHLATRMRRNAESLLVLAGIDSGRRLRDAMPLSDVIRTASSEIEQYDRVELDLQVDPHMLGFNALGAAHMLAELLENATIFSEPETPVTVTTGVSGQHVYVRILDHGLGMTEAELAAANSKIVSVSASDALGAQRLGLFVVGRLAQRLGAEVRLHKSSQGTGTETIVRFPSTLFAATETALYGAPSAPQQAAQLPASPAPVEDAPVVREVDLAALTDGQTGLGLPRRKRTDDTGENEVAPSALPVRGGGQPSGLPTRSAKTFDEDKIVLPEVPSGNLSADLGSAGGEWTPPTIATTPLNSGLPSRSRASTSAWASTPEPEATPAPAAPSSPAARAGLFSGFRGRGDLATGTPASGIAIPGLASDDDVDRPADPVRAPWMSLGAHSAPAEPMVVPQLADDDDEWSPTPAEQVEDTDRTDEVAVEAAPDAQEPVWAPTPVAEAEEQTWAPAPAAEVEEPTWSPTPAAEVEEPVWAPTPAAEVEEPAWSPTPAPEVEEPAWAPTPAAEVEEPVWAPTPAAEAEPAWAPAPAAEAEPVWAPTPAAEVEEPAWAPTPAAEADEPAWAPTFAQPDATRATEAPAAESWSAPEAPAAPSALPTRSAAAAAPAASWSAPVEEEQAAPAAPATDAPVWTSRLQGFTSYSGYAGWAGRSATPQSDVPFEKALDEARAWHTGAVPVVPEPTAARAAEPQAPAAEADAWPTPAWEAPAWEPPTWQAPAWETAEPAAEVAPAPVAEPVVEPEPVAAPTFEPVQLVPDEEPEPAWQAPAAEQQPVWEAPVAEQQPVWEAPVAEQAWQAPAAEQQPAWQAPVAEQQPAWQAPAPEQAWQAPVAEQQPAWQPPVAEAPAAAEPVAEQPAWNGAPTAFAPVETAAAAPSAGFNEVVQGGEQDKPKRRWGLFGRRKGEDGAETASAPTPAAPAPVAEQSAPARTSAWNAEQPPAPAATPSWAAATWTAPPAPVPAPAPAPVPAAAATEQRPAAGWNPPDWAPRPPAAAAPAATVPHPSLPPSVAPRIGTLDDEVAAMLAMRSDIQEQALSELSQLSAYRPASMGMTGETLQRRVPSAVPSAVPAADEGKPVQRDADQLRSRLSSFQSGTSRGRRAADDPTGPNGQAS